MLLAGTDHLGMDREDVMIKKPLSTTADEERNADKPHVEDNRMHEPFRLVLGGSSDDEDGSASASDVPRSPGIPFHSNSSSFEADNIKGVARSLSSSPSHQEVIHTVDRIGSYVIGKTLGEGAFAKVKQATHTLTGLAVAIKIIYKHKITEDYVKENLRREGELMRKMDHPHVLKLLEIIETPRAYCLVTELAGGGEVLDYIVAHGCLSEKEARKYVRQMISAISHLHAHQIVHRDLKAENLLLDENLNLKIIDFGLSNSLEGKNFLMTQCGSPAYTAPELLGGKKYGPAVDIWSVGINMYAMLTGRLPFSSNNVTTLHALILDQKYDVPEHFTAECIDLLAKLLRVKPKDRISLDDLRKHPWVVRNEGEVPAEEVKSKMTAEQMSKPVLKQMVKMGNDYADVVEAVSENRCDTVSALYHLLLMKHKDHSATPSTRAVKRSISVGAQLGRAPRRNSSSSDYVEEEVEVISPLSTSFESRGMRRPGMGQRKGPPKPRSRRLSLDVASARTLSRPIPEARRSPTRTVSAKLPLRRSSRSMKELAQANEQEPSRRTESARRASVSGFRRSSSFKTRNLSTESFEEEIELPRARQLPSLRGRSTPASPTSSRRSSAKSPGISSNFSSPSPTGRSVSSRCRPRPPSSSPKRDPVIRTLRYPFSRQMVSSKHPVALFEQLKKALQTLRVFTTAGEGSDLCVACMCGDIRFEAEIVKVPRLPVHGVHFRRLKGDTDEYKELCTDIIDEMDL